MIDRDYDKPEPGREEVDRLEGPAVLEFGASWCGWCQDAQPLVEEAFGDRPELRHVKVGDAAGRPLGRSFRVKLWPTFVFLDRGREVARVVRPAAASELRAALEVLEAKVRTEGP